VCYYIRTVSTFFKIFNFLVFGLSGIAIGLIVVDKSSADLEMTAPVLAAVDKVSERTVINELPDGSFLKNTSILIQEAQESIRIYTDILLAWDILEAVKKCSNKGIRVEVILEGSADNVEMLSNWAPKNLPRVKFWMVDSNNLPTYCIVDDTKVLVSSMGLSKNATPERATIAVLTDNKKNVDAYVHKFIQTRDGARNPSR